MVTIFTKLSIFFTFFRNYSQPLIYTMRGRYEFIILSEKYEEEMNVDVDYSMPLFISAVLEFLNNLWGYGAQYELGYRTGPSGYIGWRN